MLTLTMNVVAQMPGGTRISATRSSLPTVRSSMRILFLTTAHNSLSQRAQIELSERGDQVTVAIASSDQTMREAVAATKPNLIVAPMLTRAIPEEIWRRHLCLIIHPGPPGDRGPSSLDWAIQSGAQRWGVTILQANAEMDAGDIWATGEFTARPASKSSLYRQEVVDTASRGLHAAIVRFGRDDWQPRPLDYSHPEVWGQARPPMRQSDRRIDWSAPSETVLRRLWAADSSPGVLDRIGDLEVSLFGGALEERLRGRPGSLLASRDGAICRATGDGAVWIPSLRRRNEAEQLFFKLPATHVLGPQRLANLPTLPLAAQTRVTGATYRQIWYEEEGVVGYLHFAFPNGAMSTEQCRRLLVAVRQARQRPTRVLVLLGGPDFWSNGIHLNVIEAAPRPADESWANINALNDLVLELITLEEKLVVSALQGNAGAGGVILALAADYVWCRLGIVLNPHYKGMGGLYGSEYWTYLLPRRVGQYQALELTEGLQPVGVATARTIGLIDDAFGTTVAQFRDQVTARAHDLAGSARYEALLAWKAEWRQRDEARKPLAAYRAEELAQMHRCFYDMTSDYHTARRRFVYKLASPSASAALGRPEPVAALVDQIASD